MTITEKARLLKKASPVLAASSLELRNKALQKIAEALEAESAAIFEANNADLTAANNNNLAAPIIKRLSFNRSKLDGVIEGIRGLISLPDPIGRSLLKRSLDEGLILNRISCPIGVIGIIFEARPDALVQISSLCLKSGNCAILKGGSETRNTNRVLFDVIHRAVTEAGIDENTLALAEDRSEISELLTCHDYVDLLIPRGSNSFVKYIMDNTLIPVMGHADGVCHIYVDSAADFDKAVSVIIDSKTQYVSVCNALETLLVNRSIAKDFMSRLIPALEAAHVSVHGNAEACSLFASCGADCTAMDDKDYHTEYLDYALSVKLVADVDEAVDHINSFGSHHTDCIITEDSACAEKFMQLVDSAGVYHNCSTRFADGFRYGFGAEVGISTSKLHARGPVGLDGLVTYKYRLTGNGHIVADYAEGRSHFNFRDIAE